MSERLCVIRMYSTEMNHKELSRWIFGCMGKNIPLWKWRMTIKLLRQNFYSGKKFKRLLKLPCLTELSSCSKRVFNCLHEKTCHQTCSNSFAWHSCFHAVNSCAIVYMGKPVIKMLKLPHLTHLSSCSKSVFNWLHEQTCHQKCSNKSIGLENI